MNRTMRTGRVAASIAVTTAILVAAPVIAIVSLAMQPAPDVWRDLMAYVLPRAMLDTAMLLGGVGALALLIGAGTAWLISLHDFRGRAMLVWLMPLPLAIPPIWPPTSTPICSSRWAWSIARWRSGFRCGRY